MSLAEPGGLVTKINDRGGRLADGDMEMILATVLAVGDGAEWVVASGSLPPGVSDTFYARLGTRPAGLGVRFAVDTSGPALPAALVAEPALVKPNRDEPAESVGFGIDTVADAVRAAKAVREAGAGAVLASLGEDGAVLVDGDGVRYGESVVDCGRSTVGAGDAMLAGFLAATAAGGDAFVEALSWGAAAVGLPGSRMPRPSDVDRSRVWVHATADLSRRLSGPHQLRGLR